MFPPVFPPPPRDCGEAGQKGPSLPAGPNVVARVLSSRCCRDRARLGERAGNGKRKATRDPVLGLDCARETGGHKAHRRAPVSPCVSATISIAWAARATGHTFFSRRRNVALGAPIAPKERARRHAEETRAEHFTNMARKRDCRKVVSGRAAVRSPTSFRHSRASGNPVEFAVSRRGRRESRGRRDPLRALCILCELCEKLRLGPRVRGDDERKVKGTATDGAVSA